jgi:O-antigen/teichoic acid export membrane protein
MESSRVISNSVALVLQDVAAKLIPLVTFPLVARALGPEVYGKYGFALAVTSFFGLLASPGFTAYGAREIAQHPEDTTSIVGKLMGARIGLATTSYILLIAYTFTLAPADSVTRVLLLLSGLSFLVSAVDLQWLFMGQSLMWRISNANIVARVVNAVLIVAFIRHPTDAWILPVSTAVASVTASVILIALASRAGSIRWPIFDFPAWARFLPICFTLGVASMMSMIYDQIDTVMLRYMRPPLELGLYTASYRVMTISMSFLSVGVLVFFPLFSATTQDPDKERKYVQWMADSTIAIAVPMALGGFMVAKPIALLLLGSKFGGSETLLRWLMLNILAASFAVLFSSRLVPHHRERAYLASVATGAAMNIILNLIFIPRHGAMAAVWTTIVSQLCVGAMSLWQGRDLVQPVLSRSALASAVSTACMGVALYLAQAASLRNVFGLVAVGAATYALLFGVLRTRASARQVAA